MSNLRALPASATVTAASKPGRDGRPAEEQSPKVSAPAARWLGICLPQLPLEIVSRAGQWRTPLAISDDGSKPRVVLCNEPAAAKGVTPGLSVSAASALCPALRVQTRDARAEHEVLKVIAAWAGRFTSMVCLKPPQALLLEIGASERLFGGLTALLSEVRTGLGSLGYQGRLAVAETPLCASLLARAGVEGVVTGPGRLRSRLSSVPLVDCGLDAKTIDKLGKLGLSSLADCYRLPRDGLARRFGPQMLSFLDRVLGRSPDPQTAYRPPLRFRSELNFPEVVDSVEAVLFAVNRLLLELGGALQGCDCGVQQVELRVLHRRAPPTRIELRTLSPARDWRHLQSLLKEKLERLVVPEGMEGLVLEAPRFVPFVSRSADLFGKNVSDDEDWWSLVEKLEARLGRQALGLMRAAEEHRPEYQWFHHGVERQEVSTVPPVSTAAYRPLWLLPEPVLLRSPRGLPQFRGTLELQSGSERIETGWWDGHDVSRDYYRASNGHGETFWVFKDRRNPACWYLQGIFA